MATQKLTKIWVRIRRFQVRILVFIYFLLWFVNLWMKYYLIYTRWQSSLTNTSKNRNKNKKVAFTQSISLYLLLISVDHISLVSLVERTSYFSKYHDLHINISLIWLTFLVLLVFPNPTQMNKFNTFWRQEDNCIWQIIVYFIEKLHSWFYSFTFS